MRKDGTCTPNGLTSLTTSPEKTTKANLISKICELLAFGVPFNLTITIEENTKSYGIVTISEFTDSIDFLLFGAYDNLESYRKETDCFAVSSSQISNARLLELMFSGFTDELTVQYDTLTEEDENDILAESC